MTLTGRKRLTTEGTEITEVHGPFKGALFSAFSASSVVKSPRVRTAGCLLLLALVAFPATCLAQMRVGIERTVDRARWHFDNPSSYDTPERVPHYFEQDYTLDNLWLTADASYRAGVDWHTSIAATPVREADATDYDTFFNPGGVVWVSGTSGQARVHSVRLAQAVDLGRVAGLQLTGGYRLRVDVADFLEGNRTDTRNGVVVEQRLVTTREYTSGQTHEVFIAGMHSRDLSPNWLLRVSGEASPAAVHRLAIELPDKYPGRTLVYRTTNLTASGRVELVRGHGRWPLTLGLGGTRSVNYGSLQTASRSGLSIGAGIGRSW